MLNIDELTLGEIAALEKMSGLSVDQMGDDETPKGNLLAAMAVLVKKRAGEPTFTFKQALELPLPEVQKILSTVGGLDDEGKGGSSSPGRKTSRRSSSTSGSPRPSTGG